MQMSNLQEKAFVESKWKVTIAERVIAGEHYAWGCLGKPTSLLLK